MRIFFTLFLTMLISFSGYSQARIIFNNAGIKMVGGTMATPIYLVVDNPNANALPVLGDGVNVNPAISSEDEFNKVKWNIGSSTGVYTVPFISTTGGLPEYVSPQLQIMAGGSATGFVEFSTYHHDNTLLGTPSDVTHMNQHPNGSTGGELYAMDRFWIVDASSYGGSKPTMGMAFVYDEDEMEASMLENDLLIQRFNPAAPGGPAWLDLNLSGSITMDPTNNIVSFAPGAVGGTDFLRSWTVTSQDNPLPIELLRFESECKGTSGVELTWSTASEVNNSHFTLDKSEDGIVWEKFADNIIGAGNSSSQNSYSAMDNNPYRGLTYYRLTQTDFDGTSESFSPIVNDCDGVGFEIISAYGTSDNQLQLVVSAARDENFDIEVLDMSGKTAVFEQNVNMLEGLNYLSIEKGNISYGMYMIKLQSENEFMTRKILLD